MGERKEDEENNMETKERKKEEKEQKKRRARVKTKTDKKRIQKQGDRKTDTEKRIQKLLLFDSMSFPPLFPSRHRLFLPHTPRVVCFSCPWLFMSLEGSKEILKRHVNGECVQNFPESFGMDTGSGKGVQRTDGTGINKEEVLEGEGKGNRVKSLDWREAFDFPIVFDVVQKIEFLSILEWFLAFFVL